MSQQQKAIHLLPLCHIVIMLAIAIWWGFYFWRQSPSRELFHLHEPTPGQAGIGDLAWSGAILLLVGLCTGVYVRRFDTWLSARTSGQAAAFRDHDLTTATFDANTQQQRGSLR